MILPFLPTHLTNCVIQKAHVRYSLSATYIQKITYKEATYTLGSSQNHLTKSLFKGIFVIFVVIKELYEDIHNYVALFV